MRELRPWHCGLIASVSLLIAVRLSAFKQVAVRRLDAEALVHLAQRHWETRRGELADVFVHLGGPAAVLLMGLLVCGFALWRRGPAVAVAAAALIVGANLSTQLLKHSLGFSPLRWQPLLGWDQIGDAAFPSGHVTAAASIAFALVLVAPRAWRPAAVGAGALLVAAVALSVVIRHSHYPSDAVAGVLVAAAWFCIAGGSLALWERAASIPGPESLSTSGRM